MVQHLVLLPLLLSLLPLSPISAQYYDGPAELADYVPQIVKEQNRPPQDLETPQKALKAMQGYSQYEAWRKEYEKASKADPMRPPEDLEKPPAY